MRPKISIIGAGTVGREVALWCALKELGDIVLWNRTASTAKGYALDIMETGPLVGFDSRLRGTGDIAATRRSSVIVFTAGLARKPGQTREDLAGANARIVAPIVKRLAALSPEAFLLMVTNPVDAMAHIAWKASAFPSRRVVGMAGVLDSSRLSAFAAAALKVSVKDIRSMVLGSHGEEMVPLARFSTVRGIPLPVLLSKRTLRELEQRTKNAGIEIVQLLNANASISTGAVAARLVEAVLHDEQDVVPCSVHAKGYYGLPEVYIGLPIVLGKRGVERVLRLPLLAAEKKKLHKAAASIRAVTCDALRAAFH